MNKKILYMLSGMFILTTLTLLWSFRTPAEVTGSYASVDLTSGANAYAVFAYAEGNPEEMKFEKGKSDPEMIVQITNKMEAKGYTLDQFAVSNAVFHFIFKKRI